jgi:4-amino-4-deoxy-L-arabinose transferase-like glycosyltransferase
MQFNGWNQNAHYALVLSLARGTPVVDRALGELGDLSTGDTQIYHGHSYSAKAPGLAFASMPAYYAVRATGARTVGDTTKPIWPLHVFTVALAGLLTAILLRLVGDRLARGLGAIAAVTFGLATLALPFSTLYFSHVLSAALGFLAFVLLWRQREEGGRLWLVAAGGVSAGLAVVTEYPLALVAAILGLYALARPRRAAAGLAYAGGLLLGAAPLALYNWWAFGKIAHLSYEGRLGGNAHGRLPGFFGLSRPDLHALPDLLFSTLGLVTLTPVVVCGLVGLGLLFREGRRAEAATAFAIAAGVLLVAASYFDTFGGLGPPRYLVAMLPFLCVGLALAWRAFPATTAALALLSAFQMSVQTATGPLAAYDGEWMHRLRSRGFVETGAAFVGVTGWYAILPFFGAVGVAAVSAVTASPRLVSSRLDRAGVALGLLLWATIAFLAPNAHGRSLGASYIVVLAAVCGGVTALAFGVGERLRRSPGRLLKRDPDPASAVARSP